MIDTDKYEGHEPAPWEYCPDSECILASQNEETGNWPILVELPERAFLLEGEWMVRKRLRNRKWVSVKIEDYGKSVWWGDRLSALDASHKLMADAPLLLEEVKRLKKLLNHISDLFEGGLCYSDEWWATDDSDEQEKLPLSGLKIADSGVDDWPNVHFCSKKVKELRGLLP